MNLFARKDMLPFNSFFVDDQGRLKATSKNGRFYQVRFKESGYAEVIAYRMVWE
jgi:hypothetical protein